MEIVPLKKAEAATIYSTVVDYLKQKGIQFSKLVGMEFDGTASVSGGKTAIQCRLKKNSSHALLVHCQCNQLQCTCVQAANHTSIKRVYTTLNALWKCCHYSTKRAKCLNEIKSVLVLPEMMII